MREKSGITQATVLPEVGAVSDDECDRSGRIYLSRVTWPAAKGVGEGRFLVHGADAAAFFHVPTRGLLSWGAGPVPFMAHPVDCGTVLSGPAVEAAAGELSDVGSVALFRHVDEGYYEGRILHRDCEIGVVSEASGMGPVRTSWWARGLRGTRDVPPLLPPRNGGGVASLPRESLTPEGAP